MEYFEICLAGKMFCLPTDLTRAEKIVRYLLDKGGAEFLDIARTENKLGVAYLQDGKLRLDKGTWHESSGIEAELVDMGINALEIASSN